MSKALTFKEFAEIINFISSERSITIQSYNSKYPHVKYIDPTFDMRTNTVFSVKLRGSFGERSFYCTNEARDIAENMYERIMKFLNTERGYE